MDCRTTEFAAGTKVLVASEIGSADAGVGAEWAGEAGTRGSAGAGPPLVTAPGRTVVRGEVLFWPRRLDADGPADRLSDADDVRSDAVEGLSAQATAE